MRRVLAFIVGFVGAYALFSLAEWVLRVNPLWFKKWAPTPESIPEWMVREARTRGDM